MPVITRRRAKSLEAKKDRKKSIKRLRNTLRRVNPNNVPTRNSISRSLSRSLKKNNNLVSNLDKSFKSIRRLNHKKLGQGDFGIVQRPPGECLNRNDNKIILEHYASKDYVSKLTESIKAEQEKTIADNIRERIPDWYDYYCLVEYICSAPNPIRHNGDEIDTLAIMPYCGISLENLISDSPKINIDAHGYWFILFRLKQLIKGINKLNFNNIFHLDIHPGNIAFNWPENKREIRSYTALKLLLIDFGQAIYLPDIDPDSKTILSSELMDMEQLLLKVIVPVCNYIIKSNIFLKSKEVKLIELHDDIKSFVATIHHKFKIPNKSLTQQEHKDILDIGYDILQKYNTLIPDYKKPSKK